MSVRQCIKGNRGFILKNTLSENGAVTRGICETNEEGYLTAVHETSNIVKTPEGAAVDNDGQLTSIGISVPLMILLAFLL